MNNDQTNTSYLVNFVYIPRQSNITIFNIEVFIFDHVS